jgi:hypothetical protein
MVQRISQIFDAKFKTNVLLYTSKKKLYNSPRKLDSELSKIKT